MTKLINYEATLTNTKIRYHKSNMILHTHSDAPYLSSKKDINRAGGFHFFSYIPSHPAREKLNGAVYVLKNLKKYDGISSLN